MNSPIRNRTNTRLVLGAAFFAALGLAACSSESNSDFSTLFDVAGSVFHSDTGSSITLQQASAISYATMGFRIGDGAEAMGILTTNSGELLWVVGARASFVTRNGRLVRTAGLEHNLDGMRLEPTSTFSPIALANGQPADTDWSADFSDRNIFSAEVHCHAQAAGPEDVTVLGGVIHTVRVNETCRCPAANWSFQNVYWIGQASGRIWKARQHIHPDADVITTELLRAPVQPGSQ